MGAIKRYGFVTIITASLVALLVQGVRADEKKPSPALEAPVDSAGQAHNAEGIKYYNQGQWEEAEKHFLEAVKSDEQLAQAHYNLALALDMLGQHREAGQEFNRAFQIAPDNPLIADSPILKAHLERMLKQN